MLSIKVNSKPTSPDPYKYGQAITHLASSTIASLGSASETLESAFGVHQVCCWTCEKPLINKMSMCSCDISASDRGKARISIIKEADWTEDLEQPLVDDDEESSPDSIYSFINESVHKDRLLICEDCKEGLRRSLTDFDTSSDYSKLIKDPSNPDEPVIDPKNPDHYLWPNDTDNTHYISHCFRYVKQSAFSAQEYGTVMTDDFEVKQNGLEQHIFIEPNPFLSKGIYVRARNTIKLFRLNGVYYDYSTDGYHNIQYRANDHFLDDLRLAGRDKAYKRARTALKQLKNVRHLFLNPDTISYIIEQQKIIVELNGYRSVWAAVFNDGNDPDGLRDILGVPVGPMPVNTTLDERIQGIESEKGLLDVHQSDAVAKVRQLANEALPQESEYQKPSEIDNFLTKYREADSGNYKPINKEYEALYSDEDTDMEESFSPKKRHENLLGKRVREGYHVIRKRTKYE